MVTVRMPHPLDDPIRGGLLGAHARFAERQANVLRYHPDVAPFLAFPEDPDEADWAAAAEFVGPGGLIPLRGAEATPPDGWEIVSGGKGVQMVAETLRPEEDPEAVVLSAADVPEMLALVGRTRPGPFRPRTVALGTYLGLRRDGTLVAMAGERMHPDGWTEISAVCTDEQWRGHGFGSRLVRAVAVVIMARGDHPFLHAVATNPAIRLYEELGFTLRRTSEFTSVRVPGALRLARGHGGQQVGDGGGVRGLRLCGAHDMGTAGLDGPRVDARGARRDDDRVPGLRDPAGPAVAADAG
jgi:ribosomal protein S18 acetylase RimI-like enzyme